VEKMFRYVRSGVDRVAFKGALRRVALQAALLALLWWALTEGNPDARWVGAVSVVCATLAGLALVPESGWRWTAGGFARFVPYFLHQSLGGGLDVALRSLRPSLPLDPDVVDYALRLPGDPARVFMANVVSLLPGTLSAELDGPCLRIHTLTTEPRMLGTLRELESRVADLFGLALAPEKGAARENRG
jgi:multicomponent Na+:H+ antiporter subunit E